MTRSSFVSFETRNLVSFHVRFELKGTCRLALPRSLVIDARAREIIIDAIFATMSIIFDDSVPFLSGATEK